LSGSADAQALPAKAADAAALAIGSPAVLARARHALMAGNFAIGCGVMVVAGSLNDLVLSLKVSVAVGGQLISVAAVCMALGAPLLAAALSRWDRRTLLALALAWYALWHAVCALMPSYAALLPPRALAVLGAAVFTPQAAAAITALAPPAERGRAIAFIFLGWSVSSVVGMPVTAWVAETLGWRSAFGLVGALSAIAALWVWRALPSGIRTQPLAWRDWRLALTHPLLIGVVAVTALSSAGQFTVFSYFAPYYRQVLGASAGEVSLLFLWFGAFGLLGNMLVGRGIERLGVARFATAMIGAMALSLLLWPLAAGVAGMALVLVPWALGCFSSNSSQQARLGATAPGLAGASLALNTSAIYVGQAAGSAGGGAWIATRGFEGFSLLALGWMLLAVALSAWLGRKAIAAALPEAAPR
jgi:predicted MFS family arabinose efflux permease